MQERDSWWQTVPGMITAAAGLVTAVAGLIVALQQAGVIGPGTTSEPPTSGALRGGADAVDDAGTGAVGRADPGNTGTSTVEQAVQGNTGNAATLLPRAAGATAHMGTVDYTILRAALESDAAGRARLRLSIRMANGQTFPANLWDDTFRLVVGGVPRAPTGGLNKVVEARSAGEGDVVFEVPAGTPNVLLRFQHGDDVADIPIDLSGS